MSKWAYARHDGEPPVISGHEEMKSPNLSSDCHGCDEAMCTPAFSVEDGQQTSPNRFFPMVWTPLLASDNRRLAWSSKTRRFNFHHHRPLAGAPPPRVDSSPLSPPKRRKGPPVSPLSLKLMAWVFCAYIDAHLPNPKPWHPFAGIVSPLKFTGSPFFA